MSIIKRLSTTFVASIDQLVNEIENHDAVIQASLVEMRKKIATAHVRQRQLQRDEQSLHQKIQSLQAQADKWRTRALECGNHDESRALACLQQRKQCQQQAEQLTQERIQYQQAAQVLVQDIARSEQQCNDMAHRHRLLRARQTTAEAASATAPGGHCQDTLQNAFERWEVHIAQADALMPPGSPVDPLEAEFASAEQHDTLRAELAAMLNEETGHAR